MNEAVFISDLHLHPDRQDLHTRFEHFLSWAKAHTTSLYILGDFFHVWAGDDLSSEYSDAILQALKQLTGAGIAVYFMAGNRDFLLGERYLAKAHVQYLKEPTVIELGGQKILLTHGDRYCTQDKAHMFFRRLTRAHWFKPLFLTLPKSMRKHIVMGVRQRSAKEMQKKHTPIDAMPDAVKKHLKQHDASVAIHGHTHKPVAHHYKLDGKTVRHYILSDWDVPPQFLCYNSAKGFHFKQLFEEAANV